MASYNYVYWLKVFMVRNVAHGSIVKFVNYIWKRYFFDFDYKTVEIFRNECLFLPLTHYKQVM